MRLANFCVNLNNVNWRGGVFSLKFDSCRRSSSDQKYSFCRFLRVYLVATCVICWILCQSCIHSHIYILTDNGQSALVFSNWLWFLPRDATMLARSWGSWFCPSVCPSVHPSVTRMLCNKTKQCTADILIPYCTNLWARRSRFSHTSNSFLQGF